jgi:uncharacterized membrane protein YgdD (TMEM256/DUF423 family)
MPLESQHTPDWLVIAAAASAILAIAAGAFAAHAMSGKPVEWLHTGMEYQLAHAIVAMSLSRVAKWRMCAWIMICAAGVFSGSLYLMAIGLPHWLGAVTPLGGVGMMAGWLCLVIKEFGDSA